MVALEEMKIHNAHSDKPRNYLEYKNALTVLNLGNTRCAQNTYVNQAWTGSPNKAFFIASC